ncbi:aldehyde dehydrogenase family protein [Streptomyces alanosinicus]|nr:aldehyde dehydrogenase family protein [Streptomyces alanosinicus]
MTIDGRADTDSGAALDVANPATGEVFAQVPQCDRQQLDEACAAAERAYRPWRADDAGRRRALSRMADVLERAATSLARMLTQEQGKPLAEARTEIARSALWLRYYADLDIPREVTSNDAGDRVEIVRRPLGVVAAIAPWNFPLLLAVRKIAPALRAGNTVVLKPSPYTPLTTLAFGALVRDDLPPGVLNIVSGPEPLGAWLVSHPVPRKVSFTGSTATGMKVAAAAATGLKHITLELGGNDPAIVLPDADPDHIADSLFWSAFRNNGQVCAAVKRVYAHERIQGRLLDALTARARAVRVGDGLDETTELGPLSNPPQLGRVHELVKDALAHGATAVTGGRPLHQPGYFFAPTILSAPPGALRIVDEEQFGPALPVVPYQDLEEAIFLANAGEYGLTASVWSSDGDRAAKAASALECGQVTVNAHATSICPSLPFGGHKRSGIGVENGPWGLHEFTGLQVLPCPAA